MSILGHIDEFRYRASLRHYRASIPAKVAKIREKDIITVCFVLTNLAVWKTELLYKTMLEHPRFDPCIAVTFDMDYYPSENIRNYNSLTDYLSEKGYEYMELKLSSLQELQPDIIFYDKPYDNRIEQSNFFMPLRGCSLFCYISYAFTNANFDGGDFLTRYTDHCWKYFVETPCLKQYLDTLPIVSVHNFEATGVPKMDELLHGKPNSDPWKKQSQPKKRIIYAPHHSIDANSLLGFDTFLQYGESILELAKQQASNTQWVFKPHPVLRLRLLKHWPKAKVDAYYNDWANGENTQLEEGLYVDLFKTSDALIHDSCSFQVEYLFMNKPLLYLFSDTNRDAVYDKLNKWGGIALDHSSHAFTFSDVEQFVQSVLNNSFDEKAAERAQFVAEETKHLQQYTACDNIINSILFDH